MMSKQQFMLKKASMEWNQCRPRGFVRLGILEGIGSSSKYYTRRFSKLPEKIQNKLAKFAEYALEYSDDWKEYCVKHKLTEVKQQ